MPLPSPASGRLPRRLLRRTGPAAKAIDPGLAAVLGALSLALLGIFLAAVLVPAWPPKLLDPQWQLGLIQNLINNGSLALVGALLTHLAMASIQTAIASGPATTPSANGPWRPRSASCC